MQATQCQTESDRRRERIERVLKQRVWARERLRLDVARFRADVARSKAKADALRAREATRPKSYVPPDGAGDGVGAMILMNPTCVVGPPEVCYALADVVKECDARDGAACMAVAQYLMDTPPYASEAAILLMFACKYGEQAACDREAELARPLTKPCADDPYWCARVAGRTDDDVLRDEACVAGSAESCMMVQFHVDEPELRRRYLEEACQLGNGQACTWLGKLLAPGCTEDDGECLPPDPAQSVAALAIGCAAGWAAACN